MGKLVVGLIVSLWVIPISILVNSIVPDAYMDEIFHIPQVQQYCKGNFKSWDPMITTPPGLYYLSLAHIASLFPGMLLLQRISSFTDLCSTAILRSVNGALAVICSILIYEIIAQLRPALDRRKATVYTIVLSLYPLHWFFTYLYYTDVASLVVFLAMYLASLKKNYVLSALLGALAVCIRQTNIIWMLFVACGGVIDMLLANRLSVDIQKSNLSISEKDQITPTDGFVAKPGIRRRKMKSTLHVPRLSATGDDESAFLQSHLSGDLCIFLIFQFLRNAQKDKYTRILLISGEIIIWWACGYSMDCMDDCGGLLDEIQYILVQAWHSKWELVVSFSPFLFVLVAFVAFVYWNGSVVLGAKEAHAVSPHFSQILYFAMVSALFSAPFHFTLGHASVLLRSFWKLRPLSFFLGFVIFAAGLLSVHFFSIAHPYLLADNRHYPFYIWRKVSNIHQPYSLNLAFLISYLMTSRPQDSVSKPAEGYVQQAHLSYPSKQLTELCFAFLSTGKSRSRIWVLAYFLACAAVLVPTPLIEFRYYTIPFFIFMLNCGIDDINKWLLMAILYVVINSFTMYMFLFRSFQWSHESGVQRFIW
uniref:Dol-P-Glc:Glc(2)Man(9)GlcNAc(2)-PP-Dol alpha-1,2-glucosyltransferase n=1 Tax=Chenopodium quinoa TaxID=63459 RepID=A0A803MJ51_CHEQI